MPAISTAFDSDSTPQATRSGWSVSWLELVFFLVVLIGGFVFLRDAPHWGRNAYTGGAQYGDAEFWWNGALHFSHGIVAENPNLTYRMGYAVFGGLVAAVCGPDYRVFHQILVGIFLLTACGLYGALRGLVGKVAGAGSVLLFVFNPFSAEWLAISTSDGLGLILNLIALIALIIGLQRRLRLRWIAVFGLSLACASLTRPLMTPFIAPAVLAVIAAAWGTWRKIAAALGVMLAAFILPTVAWAALMAATTGNFALTGENQDSSAFYAASDPRIQVWRGDMYTAVQELAKKQFKVEQPTAKQLNTTFWFLTRNNYREHAGFHVVRLWRNAFELARFTPQRATAATVSSARWNRAVKWSVIVLLAALTLRRRKWAAACAIVVLGGTWAIWPQIHPWLVLGSGLLALGTLAFGRRGWFLFAAYWWVGVMALYLTGGTWGPPIAATQDLNALGYRLGFQFFFAGDMLVVGLLGCLAMGSGVSIANHPLLNVSALAGRLTRMCLIGMLGLLAILLGTGGAIVAYRLVARARQATVSYPDVSALSAIEATRMAMPSTAFVPLLTSINAHSGAPLLTRAMSSGFIWNLPGQRRSVLLLYQQDNVLPISMNPRRFDVEISRHLPERAWMNRQGAWVIRPFPNTAQDSNLPYYLEMPAVQAFIPLAKDGRSYDVAGMVVFPLAKSATQLYASGELIVHGASPKWAGNSGAQHFPRRFSLQASPPGDDLQMIVDLGRASGNTSFRFGVQLESTDKTTPVMPVHVRLSSGDEPGGTALWEKDLLPTEPPVSVERAFRDSSRLRLKAEHLRPTDTLWFYELVLTADDFSQ